MQQQDQPVKIEAGEEGEKEMGQAFARQALKKDQAIRSSEEGASQTSREENSRQKGRRGLDWLAVGLLLFVAAFFAVTARFNSQPAPSFVPAAALSATGCGLLVTALRKLRSFPGIGVLEAALGGFFLAFFQFAIALTYPNVFTTITSNSPNGRAFLLTWGLIVVFTIALSMAGAALGHLAFAPPRPLPERARQRSARLEEEENAEEDEQEIEPMEEADENAVDALAASGSQEQQEEARAPGASVETEDVEKDTERDESATEEEGASEEGEEESEAEQSGYRSLLNYIVPVLLLGFLPMIVGYVFAAAYDALMNAISANSIAPGLYPTLSLLSGLLPWRLAVPITLTGANGPFIIFTLLWRIPDSFLGNPNVFDVQTLEPLFLNSSALALLLITTYGREQGESAAQHVPTGLLVFLEALLGLTLVLPASLWILRGLEGVFQIGGVVVPLPSVQLLDRPMLILNLVTAPLFCLLVGLIVRRQYQLWKLPRRDEKKAEES